MSTESTDKRRFSRVPFDTEAYIVDTNNRWHTELLDVSLKGALLKSPVGWNGIPGNSYSVELLLGGEEITINMDVSVAHIEDDCIGFRCDHIDLESIAHLKRLIELNLGDADLVNRELASLGQTS
ncbi:MAG: PilZ domain-containing protein [Gammaproteobacteria bacterium]